MFVRKSTQHYLCDIIFNPTIENIRVQRNNNFNVDIGSFKINIPASTVKVAPNPDHTAYPTLTLTPLSMALYNISILNDTDIMKDSIHRYISLPEVVDIFDKLNAKTASKRPPIINNIQFIFLFKGAKIVISNK